MLLDKDLYSLAGRNMNRCTREIGVMIFTFYSRGARYQPLTGAAIAPVKYENNTFFFVTLAIYGLWNVLVRSIVML